MVPMVANKDDVREIAVRLERCFDNPFTVEDYALDRVRQRGNGLLP